LKNYILWSLWIFLVISIGCTQESKVVDRYEQISDSIARDIIKASISHAGGIEKWESIKQLNYTKDFSLLLPDGKVERSFEQVHEYHYEPLDLLIMSKENGDMIQTQLKDGKYSRLKNGEPMDIKKEALVKAVNTSTYVIGMPFKLLDPGVEIVYDGELLLENNNLVDVIEVSYDPGKNKNHSTADVWKYYFDKDDRKIVGNWVQTGDHANIIENLTYERVGGILFNKKRKSWRLDSLGKKTHVRADYDYNNYEVKF